MDTNADENALKDVSDGIATPKICTNHVEFSEVVWTEHSNNFLEMLIEEADPAFWSL